MEKSKIILADSDLSYLAPIELLLLREHSDRIELQIITDSGYLRELLSDPQRIDILVINEELWQDEFRRQDIRQLFFLCEEEQPKIHTEENDILLYKYTSARDVYASINIVLRRMIGTQTKMTSRVIMVYSPQGGSGKTTVSIGLCCALASLGSKVLYMSLEPLQTFSGLLSEARAMDEVLVHQMISSRVEASALQANILHAFFDYLAPMQYPMTSYGIREELYTSLLQAAVGQLGYDFIVLDCSCDFTSGKASLMKSADFVVLPFRADRDGLYKFSKLRKCINTGDTEKFIFVQTPSSAALSRSDAAGEDFPPSLVIPPVAGLDQSGPADFAKIQSSSAFTELTYRFL